MSQRVEDRVRRMYRAERKRKGMLGSWYPNISPQYAVARVFKIPCARVMEIVRPAAASSGVQQEGTET